MTRAERTFAAYIPLAYVKGRATMARMAQGRQKSRYLRFAEWIGVADAVYIVYSWWTAKAALIPLLVSVVTGVSAMAEHVPLYMAILVTVSAFFLTSGAILFTSAIYDRFTPRNKFQFVSFTPALKGQVKDGVPTILGVRGKLEFINNAKFPISYIIDDIRLSIDKRIEYNEVYANRGIVIDPGQPATFFTHRIEFGHPIEVPEEPKNIPGRLTFSVRYGRPGKEKFPINRRLRLDTNLDREKFPALPFHWFHEAEHNAETT
ncbi:MAG: hypothetical protein ACREDO_14005 [Methyloceanibacter sp.]